MEFFIKLAMFGFIFYFGIMALQFIAGLLIIGYALISGAIKSVLAKKKGEQKDEKE